VQKCKSRLVAPATAQPHKQRRARHRMVAPTKSASSVIAFRRHTHISLSLSLGSGWDTACGQATPWWWWARWCSQERAAGGDCDLAGEGGAAELAREGYLARIPGGAPHEGSAIAQIWGFGRTAAVLLPRCSSNPHLSSPPASDSGGGHGVRARWDLMGVSAGGAAAAHDPRQALI
jgi:hypothetical protein